MPKAATVSVAVGPRDMGPIIDWLQRELEDRRSYLSTDAGGIWMEAAHDRVREAIPLMEGMLVKFTRASQRKRTLRPRLSRFGIPNLRFNLALNKQEAKWLADQVPTGGMFGQGRKLHFSALPLSVRDLCNQCRAAILRKRGRPRLAGTELRSTVQGEGPALSERQYWRRRARWRSEQSFWTAVDQRHGLFGLTLLPLKKSPE